MLIDFLTQRFCFSREGGIITAVCYFAAAAIALFLHRLGQFQKIKKYTAAPVSLGAFLRQRLGGNLWGMFFFLVTGCLYPAPAEVSEVQDKGAKKSIFWGGVRSTLYATTAFYTFYTVFQLADSLTEWSGWWIFLLITKALTCANLSLLWFSILPLPCSEAEILLRKKPFGEKGIAFRSNGTMPFFVSCLLGLLLACITLPFPGGQVCSLSGILTLFPVLLIGG